MQLSGLKGCSAPVRVCRSSAAIHSTVPAGFSRSSFLNAVSAPSAGISAARDVSARVAAVVDAPTSSTDAAAKQATKVIIAGAGIGGLVLAVALLKQGFDVQVFERDLTAIRGEGKYRGPIQVQSNALAALEAIDAEMAEEIMAHGTVTGDRVNGLCDGETGNWYVKFDTFHPAVDKGLPVTRVISRMVLQRILAKYAIKYADANVIQNACRVVDFEEFQDTDNGKKQVRVKLENGQQVVGDMLIGADGIWSRVRTKIVGETAPNYSGYTCYTGISNFVPPDINTVGYRVFLGNRQYFVSSDVGGGQTQWYAFHEEAAGGHDEEGHRKERLLSLFGHWCDNVTDLIKATPEDDVLRRDIYDRAPIMRWSQGNVALLGDAAHAMQPNLGQGGCMAIEDGYELAVLLSNNVDKMTVNEILKKYTNQRMVRVASIHGLARMAAMMASTYKAYLGEGMGPLAPMITKWKIPHPGRVMGRFWMLLTMPGVLSWVLSGNPFLESSKRAKVCRLDDAPKSFKESNFDTFLKDDEALLRAAQADWLLVPYNVKTAQHADVHSVELPAGSIEISSAPIVIGRGTEAQISVDGPGVSDRHAIVEKTDKGYYITVGVGTGKAPVSLNGARLPSGSHQLLHPGDVIAVGDVSAFKIKMRHISLRNADSLYAAGLDKRAPTVQEQDVELVA